MSSSVREIESREQAAIARIFSAAVFQELIKTGKSPTFARLIKESGLEDNYDSGNVGQLFDYAFELLKKKIHRNEYTYKTAIAQKILLGAHSLHTASLIGELRVGANKADLVILNGTSTAYEIKSERDRLDRLESQIISYCDVFASVNVLCAEKHLNAVMDLAPNFVGVSVLTSRFQISSIRKCINDPRRTSSCAILDSITRKEAFLILNRLNIDVPSVPNTKIHGVLKDIYGGISSESIHNEMVQVLKITRNLSGLAGIMREIPISLRAFALTVPIGERGRDNLFCAIDTPVLDALKWG